MATAVSFETQFTTLSCKPRTNHLYWHFITTVCYLSRCQESCSFYSRIKINADSQKLHSRPFSANKIKSKLIKCSHAKIILIVQLRGIQLPFDFFFCFDLTLLLYSNWRFEKMTLFRVVDFFPTWGINLIHFPVLEHNKPYWTHCIPFAPFYSNWEAVAALDFTNCFNCVTQQPTDCQKDFKRMWC